MEQEQKQHELEALLIKINDAITNRGLCPGTGFSCHHVWITNPYMDSDGRFQVDGDPAETYGEAYLKSCFRVDTENAIVRATEQLCNYINGVKG